MNKSQNNKNRLLYKEKKSKKKWKDRALSYQKRIIALNTSVRDMIFSRDKWKIKTKKYQNLLKEKDAEIKRLKQELYLKNAPDPKDNTEPIVTPEIVDLTVYNYTNSQEIITSTSRGYNYPIFIIQLAIQQKIKCFSSWRSIQKTFQLWSQFLKIPIQAL